MRGCVSCGFLSCPAPSLFAILGSEPDLNNLSEFWGPPQQLEQLAKHVNELLFQPKLPHRPLKTLELPVAGEVYAAQSLPLIVEFIEIVNQSMPNDMGK